MLRDDYKSTIDTVYAALDTLEQLPARRRIIVLGDLDAPPPPERPHYRAVGRRVAQVADEAIFVGVKFAAYRAGARSGGMGDDRMTHAASIHAVIRMLQGKVGPGDVLLVKGREGQRLTRIILGLQGRAVRCTVDPCRLHLRFCDHCPLLGQPHGGPPSDV